MINQAGAVEPRFEMRLPRLGRVGLLLLPLLMLALPLGAFTLTFGLFDGGGFVGFTLVPPKRVFGRWRRTCAVDQVWSFACVSVCKTSCSGSGMLLGSFR